MKEQHFHGGHGHLTEQAAEVVEVETPGHLTDRVPAETFTTPMMGEPIRPAGAPTLPARMEVADESLGTLGPDGIVPAPTRGEALHTVPAGPQDAVPGEPAPAAVQITSKSKLVVTRLLRNKGAVLGLIIFGLVILFALFGRYLTPFSYEDMDMDNLSVEPGVAGHLLGTDDGGKDMLAMMARGTGKSLLIAAVVGILAPMIGAVYGTTIAFWGGKREAAGMWLLDMLILLPAFLLIAVLMQSTGGDALMLAIIMTAVSWMGLARVVRATTQSLREREFIISAKYLGVSDWEIIRRHIVPNIGSYLILNIVLQTFGAVQWETALSFLGVGVKPPDVSLGQLIGYSSNQVEVAPWLFWGPTSCLIAITFSLALIGDGLRDALDPNSKSGGKA